MNIKFRIIRFGAAKALTQAQMPVGELENGDLTSRWGI